MERQCDVLVIGGGPGGYVSAIRLAQLGRKVVLIEKEAIGGTCVNRGCIPTKSLIHVGKIVHSVAQGARMGVRGELSIDFPKTLAWCHSNANKFRKGIEYLLRTNGVEVLVGEAAFEAPHTLSVKPHGYRLSSPTIVIATGSRPSDIPGLKFDSKTVLSSDDIFQIEALPQEMVIVGGGVIGVEMATAFAQLGTKVTVLEMMDQILPGFSLDLVTPVFDALRKLGVELRLKSKVSKCYTSDLNGRRRVQLSLDGGEELVTDLVLVAVGRQPSTEMLDLERAGVEVDQRGFVRVNDRLETSAAGIFAIGDATGLPFLAHRAMGQGLAVAEMVAGLRDTYPNLPMPLVVYSDPEIACVGLGQAEAESKGFKVLVGNFPFSASGRGQTLGSIEGFVKVIGDREDGRILGAEMVGPSVSELIGECSTLIMNCSTLKELASGVHPHPTLSEALSEAARLALAGSLHYGDRS